MNGEIKSKILDLMYFFFGNKCAMMEKKDEEFVEDFHIIIHQKNQNLSHINK
jgi:hypothetical protein